MKDRTTERQEEGGGGRVLRILWVKNGGLWPVHSGGRLRSLQMIRELSLRHHVTVVTTHGAGESEEELARNLPSCEAVRSLPLRVPKQGSPGFLFALAASWLGRLPVDLYRYRSSVMQQEVRRQLSERHFDLCIADFLSALPNVPDDLPVPVVLFSHNVEYQIWKRLCDSETSIARRLLLELEWRKMRRYEEAACRRCTMTVTVSAEDRLQLQRAGPSLDIRDIPTGVDTDRLRPDPRAVVQEGSLVFCGSMDWFPNADAMHYFMDEILPRLRRLRPDVSLTIVGRNPPSWLQALSGKDGIEVTGTVDDVRPWIQRAAVYVVPLRIGGGTRLKIYEALSLGKAVVSTSIGAEGLPLEEGVHILRSDSVDGFVSRVIGLLDNVSLRERMGRAGRDLMVERYGWPRVVDIFEHACRDAIQADAATATQPVILPSHSSILRKEKLS